MTRTTTITNTLHKTNMRIHNPFRFIFFILGAVIVVGYSLFTARFFIAGPQLNIDNPRYIETDEPLLIISGNSSNIQALWINGHEVFLEENGAYTNKRILTPGISYITLFAKDRFDRTEEKIITAYYNAPFEAVQIEAVPDIDETETDIDNAASSDDEEESVGDEELRTTL